MAPDAVQPAPPAGPLAAALQTEIDAAQKATSWPACSRGQIVSNSKGQLQ